MDGSLSLGLDELDLIAAGLPPGQPGVFFVGDLPLEVPYGQGFRCVGGQVVRLPITTADASGVLALAVDLELLVGAGSIQVGTTSYLQAWYRDPVGGGAGFNLTDGLSATWCP